MRACFCPRRAATLRGVGFTLAGYRGITALEPPFCVVSYVVTLPSLPHVKRYHLLSLDHTREEEDSAQTLMNTAPPRLFVSLSVARLFRQQRTVTAEAAGSSPVVPAIIRNPLMNGLPSMNGCSRI